ncbi:MAG: T9SS type A sorting domain-containing protein [Flavobacteriales bacterium]|nr:T9SS type A sorting domain-containing protein [Flavobacteriales bacterium]
MKTITASLFILLSLNSFGQTATYNADVSCILYEHCTSCHHDGGIAPFGLMDYQEATAAAYGIYQAVNAGTMPPWPPNHDYNQLAHERLLSQEEIDIINEWVNGGTPEGQGTAPQAPVYLSNEEITNPDLVLTMEQYTVNSIGNDVYRCFVIPTGLTEDVFITEIEVIPGNNEAVHHVLLFQDITNTPQQLDNNDPNPGYTHFGGTGSSQSKMIGSWVPGQGRKVYPSGMGVRIPAGADVVMQIHYPTTANGQTDQTKVNIKYTTGFVREVYIAPPLNHYSLNEGSLVVPANSVSTFSCDYQVPNQYDLTVLDVAPHMHLLGKSITVWAETPSNQTIPFIQINDWDFHWQGFYDFKNPIRIPAGSTVYSTATYDNTSNNPNNPNNPPQLVTAGESTTEEMMLVYFSYTLYVPGDENIVIDGSTSHPTHTCNNQFVGLDEFEAEDLWIYPIPAIDILNISSDGNWSQFRITDVAGKVIKQVSGVRSVDVSDLSAGIYHLTAISKDKVATTKFVVQK